MLIFMRITQILQNSFVDNISKVSISNEKSQEKEQKRGKFFRQRNKKEENSLDKQISWFKKMLRM